MTQKSLRIYFFLQKFNKVEESDINFWELEVQIKTSRQINSRKEICHKNSEGKKKKFYICVGSTAQRRIMFNPAVN